MTDDAGGDPTTAPPYPSHWEADVVLRDGATAHLRPIGPSDVPAIERFHAGQSEDSIYLRYFAPMPRLSARDLHRFTHVDHVARVAFVATVGDAIVGIARYDRIDATSAEIAFNVSDAHRGRGLGSVLLEHLAAAAREHGLTRFVAEVLPRNRRMLMVFRETGYAVHSHFDDGVVSVEIDLTPTDQSLAVMEGREHRAEARSMERLLHPGSVALIGAGRRVTTVGHRLLADLLAGGFTGDLHVVHPEADVVQGVATVRELPAAVDLAVVAVPAESVLGVVRDCVAAGVGGLVVVSSGFAETGPEGLARQRELVRLARANGMRVVGPNSWGLINSDPTVRLNVSLVPDLPAPGRLGLFSQSGGLSVAVLDAVARRGLGLSTFLSAGNRADVSGNDCLQYWEEDPRTDAVAMYMESFGNPRKFSRIARRLARSKPVIVLKSGSSSFGAPPGHAVRPSTAPREAFDSMLKQSGCIRVETLNQMLDVAQLVLGQPLPGGRRVGIVSNSDAIGALTADACVSWGLEVAHGPVSLRSQAGAEQFRVALTQAFAPSVRLDALVAAFIPPLATDSSEVARVLAEVSAGYPAVPVVACFLGTGGSGTATGRAALSAVGDPAPEAGRRPIPSYPTPEEAVRALAAVERYAAWRRRDPGHRVEPAGVDVVAARALVARWLADTTDDLDGLVLTPNRTHDLLDTFGIGLWPQIPVPDPDQAAAAATALGYPVAVKATAAHLRHRVDLGGVRLDIDDEAELRAAVTRMTEIFGAGGGDLVVQRMAPHGVACVIRTAEDPLFGPVVSFGLGGDASELLGDVAHRIPPLTDVDLADLVRSVRAAPKLFGHKGVTPVDVPALEDLLGRVAVLADELPEVAALEINPVVVGEVGLAVLDARVRLARPPGRADTARRELPT